MARKHRRAYSEVESLTVAGVIHGDEALPVMLYYRLICGVGNWCKHIGRGGFDGCFVPYN